MKIVETQRRSQNNLDDNMIPLINIVFLMLIFFMVAGQIMQADPIKVDLPHSLSEKKHSESPLTIVVGKDGSVAVEHTKVPLPNLAGEIKQRYLSSTDQAAFNVFVKVDGGLSVEELRAVLRQIKYAGVKRVSLATQYRITSS